MTASVVVSVTCAVTPLLQSPDWPDIMLKPPIPYTYTVAVLDRESWVVAPMMSMDITTNICMECFTPRGVKGLDAAAPIWPANTLAAKAVPSIPLWWPRG